MIAVIWRWGRSRFPMAELHLGQIPDAGVGNMALRGQFSGDRAGGGDMHPMLSVETHIFTGSWRQMIESWSDVLLDDEFYQLESQLSRDIT